MSLIELYRVCAIRVMKWRWQKLRAQVRHHREDLTAFLTFFTCMGLLVSAGVFGGMFLHSIGTHPGLITFLATALAVAGVMGSMGLAGVAYEWAETGYSVPAWLKKGPIVAYGELRLEKKVEKELALADRTSELDKLRKVYLQLGEELAFKSGYSVFTATLQAHTALEALLPPKEK